MSLRRLVRLTGLGAVVLLSPRLCAAFPHLVPPLLAFWVAGLTMDMRSTWRMYRLEPDRFSENESNIFFVPLYERLGFKRSVAPFLLLVEIPRFVFVALVCAPLIGALWGVSASPVAGTGVAAAAFGYTHLDAWRVNRRFVASKKEPAGE